MRPLALALVVGCYSPAPPAGAPCGQDNACPSGQACIAGICGGSGAEIDGAVVAVDEGIDTAPTCTSWTARHVDPCALPAPVGDLNLTQALSAYSWDTDTGALTGKMGTQVIVATIVLPQAGGPDVMLASVNNLTMEAGATLDVDGARPLLIAVNGTAQIDGDITANATVSSPGPGGAATSNVACPFAQTGNPGAAGTPATGGGGGGLQGDGGRGGNAGGNAGLALTATPTVIRGGCAGGVGGAGTLQVTTGSRGAGGGAIVIDARDAIVIGSGGSINAGGGAGGFGRANFGGGGGGGSGGLIGFNAPIITIAGTLAANGGGGGGGASDVATGVNGNNGAASGNTAAGGSGAQTTNVGACGKGGNGSFGGTLDAQDGSTVACGGGGGGGGAGFILFWSPSQMVTGTVSPPALSGP